jgi:hypothetical protein
MSPPGWHFFPLASPFVLGLCASRGTRADSHALASGPYTPAR